MSRSQVTRKMANREVVDEVEMDPKKQKNHILEMKMLYSALGSWIKWAIFYPFLYYHNSSSISSIEAAIVLFESSARELQFLQRVHLQKKCLKAGQKFHFP